MLDPLTDADLPDPLPAEVLRERRLPGLREALGLVHEPESDADWRRGRERLKYEEAFVLQADPSRGGEREGRRQRHPRNGRPRRLSRTVPPPTPVTTAKKTNVKKSCRRSAATRAPEMAKTAIPK